MEHDVGIKNVFLILDFVLPHFADPASTSPSGNLVTYNIGSTICLNIDQSDPNRNRPLQLARLQCADVGAVEEENIPSAIPSALVTWEHTSLDGTTAFFAINTSPDNIDEATYIPPEEFTMAFPGLIGADSPFTVSTDSTNALDFSVANIIRNLSRDDYLNLRMAFGFWTCTLNNSLGSQTKTSFISDTCKHTFYKHIASSYCINYFLKQVAILFHQLSETVRISVNYLVLFTSWIAKPLCLSELAVMYVWILTKLWP